MKYPKLPKLIILHLLTVSAILMASCKKGNKPTVTTESQAEKQEAISQAFSQENDLSKYASELESAETIFKKLGQAFKEKNTSGIDRIISGKQLAHYIIIKSKRKHNTRQKTQLIDLLDTKFPSILAQLAPFFVYDETKILNIDKISEHELIVYTKQWDDNQESYSKCRWWFIKEEGQWKIYDLEDLDAGSRLSTTFMIGMESSQNKEPWLEALMRLSVAFQKIDNVEEIDFEALSEDAKTLLESNAAVDIKLAGFIVYTQGLLLTEKYDEVLALIKKHHPQFKLYSITNFYFSLAYFGTENYEKAIEYAKKYGDLMGYDSEVYTHLSDCYYKLGKPLPAMRNALKGLTENPRHSTCVASYAILLKKDQWQEILPMITATKKEAVAYETVMDYLIEEGNKPFARFLFSKFKKKFPASDFLEYYEEELLEAEE